MYRPDLAYVQHHGFADFGRAASPGLLRILHQHGVTSGHVLDLGCGDGAWLRTLSRSGFSTTGIEQSATLVRYARAAAPRAIVKQGPIARLRFPHVDAITAIGEVVSYRGSAAATSLCQLFRRAADALRPGGVFVFDVLVSGQPFSYSTWSAGPTWAVLARVGERRHRVTRDIVVFRKIGRGYRRTEERHQLVVFSPRKVLDELRKAGFRARAVDSYGRFKLPIRRLAFIAQKSEARRSSTRIQRC